MPHTIERQNSRRGFTLVEVLIATVVLLIGIVGVAELVPFATSLNSKNRVDSTALVIAQREMDALTAQPLTATTFTSTQGLTCAVAANCSLGNPASPLTVVGSPVVTFDNRPFIDYTAAPVTGYNYTYSDPDNPAGGAYDIRWAVITFASGPTVYGKRFIVGVRQVGGNGPLLPVALDSMVDK